MASAVTRRSKTVNQPQRGQQGLNGGDFVGLVANFQMSEHQRRGAVQGTDQMDGGPILELVEAAAQRLAVESDDAHALATDMLGQQGGVQAKDVFQSLRRCRMARSDV